jgi:hypothetical protein
MELGSFVWVLIQSWNLFGKCLELSYSDNQLIKSKNGNKCGTCLGSVGEGLGNFEGKIEGGGGI